MSPSKEQIYHENFLDKLIWLLTEKLELELDLSLALPLKFTNPLAYTEYTREDEKRQGTRFGLNTRALRKL